MEWKNPAAEEYLPRNAKRGRSRYMSVAAHQDDIEIMAADGILRAFDEQDASFYAVVVTNGSGSAREGLYANYTDEQMMSVRATEQKRAAELGGYGKLVLLNYTSAQVKSPDCTEAVEDIRAAILEAAPEVLYTHNLCDKHDTHIGVVTKVIRAVRGIPSERRPRAMYGCEVWRDLDWLPDAEKVAFDVSRHENLLNALVGVFDSQIAGGKRYDLAAAGRKRANATYSSSHTVDGAEALSYAMDLTPLIQDDSIDPVEFAAQAVERFRADVVERIRRM